MKPSRVIAHRDQSAPSICSRMLGNWLVGYWCGAEMQLVITRSPLSGLPYEELIVTRCLAGHIATSQGVSVELDDIRAEGL